MNLNMEKYYVEIDMSNKNVVSEVTDCRVIRAGISVTWNVLSWSGGHEFEPQLR